GYGNHHLKGYGKGYGNHHPPLKVLELGTGSGAVIVSLAQECPGNLFFALDISVDAVKMARDNARANLGGDQVCFWVSSWMESLLPGFLFDVIVSNPPYIPSQVIDELQPEVRCHEPRGALDGGGDGFQAFRSILFSAATALDAQGTLIMEMGFDQRKMMAQEAASCPVYREPCFVKDYAGNDRVVVLRLK
ncbi:MAG: peptide chain release factor N(5)-glutamine methyltransferase, partial [Desulfamplus sp.]|nr:peptide chain release factor N(5)-glutamine methyltransferase [Desulfamplus sp.]